MIFLRLSARFVAFYQFTLRAIQRMQNDPRVIKRMQKYP